MTQDVIVETQFVNQIAVPHAFWSKEKKKILALSGDTLIEETKAMKDIIVLEGTLQQHAVLCKDEDCELMESADGPKHWHITSIINALKDGKVVDA